MMRDNGSSGSALRLEGAKPFPVYRWLCIASVLEEDGYHSPPANDTTPLARDLIEQVAGVEVITRTHRARLIEGPDHAARLAVEATLVEWEGTGQAIPLGRESAGRLVGWKTVRAPNSFYVSRHINRIAGTKLGPTDDEAVQELVSILAQLGDIDAG